MLDVKFGARAVRAEADAAPCYGSRTLKMMRLLADPIPNTVCNHMKFMLKYDIIRHLKYLIISN
jgi:hypothetical protein